MARQVVTFSFNLALPLKPRQVVAQLCGAGDGTRTRDNLLGRQGLCQLSYSRKIESILSQILTPVKGGVPALPTGNDLTALSASYQFCGRAKGRSEKTIELTVLTLNFAKNMADVFLLDDGV